MSSSPDWKIIRQKGWRDTNDKLVNSHFRFGSGKRVSQRLIQMQSLPLGGLMWACQESSWLGKCNEGQCVSFHGLLCIPWAGRLKQQACTVLQFRRPQVWAHGRFSFLWRLWRRTPSRPLSQLLAASGSPWLAVSCHPPSSHHLPSVRVCPCTHIPSFKNTNCFGLRPILRTPSSLNYLCRNSIIISK